MKGNHAEFRWALIIVGSAVMAATAVCDGLETCFIPRGVTFDTAMGKCLV